MIIIDGDAVEAERRKFRRLLPQKLTFAVFRPHFTKLGKVKDICKGGLAFDYILDETQNPGSSEIDVFIFGDHFYLPRIPSKIVYDMPIVEEYRSLKKRRCGLQFVDLTDAQAIELDSFLENYTTEKA
jgi:hypothetical protein